MNEVVNKENQRVAFFFRALDRMGASIEKLVANHRPPFGGEHFLTDKEVSERLKVSRRTLQDWRSEGKVAYIQLGGKTLYKVSDIEKFLMKGYHTAWK